MHQTYDRLQNLDSEANRGLSAIQTELGGLITDVGALCGEVSALNERVKALEDAVWRDGADDRPDRSPPIGSIVVRRAQNRVSPISKRSWMLTLRAMSKLSYRKTDSSPKIDPLTPPQPVVLFWYATSRRCKLGADVLAIRHQSS
jgi:hypothetical protein